jgi:probable rRNA maturation factor
MRLAVQIDDETDSLARSGITAPDYERFERVLEDYLSGKFPDTASADVVLVSLKYCSPDEMRDLNLRYRSLDENTDVLSFPMWESEDGLKIPSGWAELPLGDIAACPEHIKDCSAEEGRDEALELVLVLIHGFLHLLAWDHDTEERERNMFSEQEILLNLYREKV